MKSSNPPWLNIGSAGWLNIQSARTVHINRKNQTLRGWASAETYPPELKPIRVLGRLCWPVAGRPWSWVSERRAILRADLDAIYARLYGLSREDLRYVLDPEDIMGEGYPSQTFRGLRDKEVRHLGEYRTRRLVLEAWDRMEQGEL